MDTKIVIRNLREGDIEGLVQAFPFPWSTPEAMQKLWQNYLKEQDEGIRTSCLLESGTEICGYGHFLRVGENPTFRSMDIPEVNALWIGDSFRRRGLATQLIAHFEEMARHEGYHTLGLGVGLYKDYGPAQQLYFKLGYSPDGNGITYKGEPVTPGSNYPVDDELILWLTKNLRIKRK